MPQRILMPLQDVDLRLIADILDALRAFPNASPLEVQGHIDVTLGDLVVGQILLSDTDNPYSWVYCPIAPPEIDKERNVDM